MKVDRPEDLKHLGSNKTQYVYDKPSPQLLESFPNQFPGRDYETKFVFGEFTSLCPKTHQPDFAAIDVTYIPDKLCIETKSLKMYYLSYRMHGSFMETIVNNILDDLVELVQPTKMVVTGTFKPRGGTDIIVRAGAAKTK